MLQVNFSVGPLRAVSLGRHGLLLAVLLLTACGGRYQAPLDDQSRVLAREAPPIYSTTGTTSNTGSTTTSQASSTRATTTPAIAAGVRVQPAPGVSVNVANESGAIQRSAIGRAPIGGATTTNPANTNSPSANPTVSPADLNAFPANTGSATQMHTVVRGDTLYSIAWRYSVDYRALALANSLVPPYTIYPNQQLNVKINNVSNAAINSLPTIPVAPAGDPAVNIGERPAAAAANRRVGNVPTRVVDGVIWQWPVEGRVLSGFNASKGIDIGGRRGEPVYAAADGDVVYSGRGIQGQGDLIIIRHSARYLSAYSHNANMIVTEGARIRAGDKIAEVGTDPRGSELLHFEVRVDGKPVDPSQYLPPR